MCQLHSIPESGLFLLETAFFLRLGMNSDVEEEESIDKDFLIVLFFILNNNII